MHFQEYKLNRLRNSNSHSSIRSSFSDGLMPKVPLQMRTSLQEQKQKNKTSLKFTNIYEEFKNVITLQKQCSICLMKIKNPCSLSDCQHIFCEECVVNYLTFKINSMEEVLCPDEGCNRKLDLNSQAYKILPEAYKLKYKKQQLWYQTMKNPDLKLCPIETCNQGTINMKKIPPKCEKCSTVFCQQCMMTQHQGRPCDQNFKLNFKEWKRCPKCLMFIQKSQGCNHMVCRCLNQFCFVCLEPWNNDHYACVSMSNTSCLFIEQVRFPKLAAIGLIILLPILIVFAAVVLVAGSVISLVIGFFAGIFLSYQLLGDCFLCCAVIVLPISAVIVSIIGFVWGTFFYILPIIRQYANQYFRTINNLCHSH